MKILFSFIFISILLSACTSKRAKEINDTAKEDESLVRVVDSSHVLIDDAEMDSSEFSETQLLYVVIVDTASNYDELYKRLSEINKKFDLPIDLMDRSFNEKKNLIALSEKSDDDVFAGEYLPRRFPSTSLSLEYLSFYDEEFHPKTIAIVAGIFAVKEEAEQLLNKLQKEYSNAYILNSEIYLGCIH